jgi:SAM-dependent methyltransferase
MDCGSSSPRKPRPESEWVTLSVVRNIDDQVVKDFGSEWSRFTQEELSSVELARIFDGYFREFPWSQLPEGAVGIDIGCGSGRWAALVAPRVAHLHCVDASDAALTVCRRNLRGVGNVDFHLASVDELPFPDAAFDFAYSLGVLHHVPDAAAAIRSAARTLKPGAPLLLYLYYAFDNRPAWFRLVWRCSDVLRRLVARLPGALKRVVCDAIAIFVYWPLARSGSLLEKLGSMPSAWPLAAYRHRSLYVMRTDALDRFGTRLEQRFTQRQIREMVTAAGLSRACFSKTVPYWCVVAYRDA